MSLTRQCPGWLVLLGLGLMPADDACCIAADPPQAPRPVAAGAAGAAVPRMLEAKPAVRAAKRGSLLGAIVEALGDDRDANQRRMRAIEDQNIRNLEVQYRPQFRQLLYGELAFLRRACKPDGKSFAAVAKAAPAGLEAPLREYIVTHFMPRQGIPQGGANAPDPRSAMQKLLLPLVKEKLGPEKAQLYLQECDKRTEVRKHAVVVSLVAMLDERLVLTARQRAKLVKSLTANYENSWDQFVEMFGIGGQVLPTIREESIAPLLDDQQKNVWGQATKQSGIYGGMIVRNFLPGDATEIQEIAHIVEEGQNDR